MMSRANAFQTCFFDSNAFSSKYNHRNNTSYPDESQPPPAKTSRPKWRLVFNHIGSNKNIISAGGGFEGALGFP